MNRIGNCWHAAFGLLLWLPASAAGHVGERLYPIPFLSDEMLAEVQLQDGSIQEWYELLGEPAMTSLDFRESVEGGTPDPASLELRIWLAWHDDPARFYVAFLAADDVYKNTHDPSVDSLQFFEDNDRIELAIDGDHSGGVGCRFSNCSTEDGWADYAEAHGQTQYYRAIARTASGPTLAGMVNWQGLPPHGEGGGGVVGEAPVVSVIELFVAPFDSWENGWDSAQNNVISGLTPGQVIGFAMVVYDHDPPQEYYEVEYWVPEGVDWLDLLFVRGDGLLDGILLPVEPEVTAVEGSTWGRIKASLKVE